jgi:nudix-type nucleoside diphosphatase (YffH/AdpP family)
MSDSRKAEIHQEIRRFDGFFKVDEVLVSHERPDGTMSPDEKREIFERGDAAAIILLNLDKQCVVLVNQFKVPSMIARRRDNRNTTDGWVTEATAGMIDGEETPRQTIIRETLEETGYEIKNPQLITKFFSSPGGTSERIFLFFAEVRDADRVNKGGGLSGEDITVLDVPLADLFDRLDKGLIDDPKLAIGAYWLKDHLKSASDRLMENLQITIDDLFQRSLSKSIKEPKLLAAATWLQDHLRSDESGKTSGQGAAHRGAAGSPTGPLPYSTVRFKLKDRPDLIIGYKTGLLDNIYGASIWVNSENTDMLMDRFIGTSISARIRYLGANRDVEGNVIEDRIAEALRRVVGPRGHVRIATVLMTESGHLKISHDVRRILHVATVEASPNAALVGRGDMLPQCVEAVLKRAEIENKKTWRVVLRAMLRRIWTFFVRGIFRNKKREFKMLSDCDSVLIPMMGAGQGNLKVEEVAKIIIPAAVSHLRKVQLPTVKEVYFLVYQSRDKAACDAVFDEFCANELLIRLPDEK